MAIYEERFETDPTGENKTPDVDYVEDDIEFFKRREKALKVILRQFLSTQDVNQAIEDIKTIME